MHCREADNSIARITVSCHYFLVLSSSDNNSWVVFLTITVVFLTIVRNTRRLTGQTFDSLSKRKPFTLFHCGSNYPAAVSRGVSVWFSLIWIIAEGKAALQEKHSAGASAQSCYLSFLGKHVSALQAFLTNTLIFWMLYTLCHLTRTISISARTLV